jgi:hypothetical protein
MGEPLDNDRVIYLYQQYRSGLDHRATATGLCRDELGDRVISGPIDPCLESVQHLHLDGARGFCCRP